MLPIFEMPTAAQAVIVQSGSPRMYGAQSTDIEQTTRVGKTMLTFEFQKFMPFDEMKQLVPQNCIVGINEVVPGLNTDNSRLPKPRENYTMPLSVNPPVKTMAKKTIFLHNLNLVCSVEFEK